VTPVRRRVSQLVFPGSTVPVTARQVRAGLRNGEERRDLRTSRGEQIAVVHRPPEGSGRYVLFLYGNAMTMADTAPIRAVLASEGSGVVCVDYVGYGLSPGEPSEGGCYRAAHAALTMIEQDLGVKPGTVDVVGWSLGSAVSLHVASHRAVNRLVLMSPFAGIAPYLLGPLRLQHTPLRRLGPFAGARRVGKVSCPVLLITGDADDLTPPWMAKDLAAGLPGTAELVLIPGAGHNDLFAQPTVWRRALDFIGAPVGS
jgi:uncharacterized protein